MEDKRLIEVDFLLKEVSEESVREKEYTAWSYFYSLHLVG